MEVGTIVYEASGSAPVLARDLERKDEDLRREQVVAKDTINISEAARELLRMREGGEAPKDFPGRDGENRNPHQYPAG